MSNDSIQICKLILGAVNSPFSQVPGAVSSTSWQKFQKYGNTKHTEWEIYCSAMAQTLSWGGLARMLFSQ